VIAGIVLLLFCRQLFYLICSPIQHTHNKKIKYQNALRKRLYVISTEAPVLAFVRKHEGGVEKSIKKRFLDPPFRYRRARNGIYLLSCDFNIAHTKLIEGISQNCFFLFGQIAFGFFFKGLEHIDIVFCQLQVRFSLFLSLHMQQTQGE